MQSGLESVGNGDISTFAGAFAPKMCETGVSRLKTSWTFLQDLSIDRAVSRFSMYVPSCKEIDRSPSLIFRSNWSKYDYDQGCSFLVYHIRSYLLWPLVIL